MTDLPHPDDDSDHSDDSKYQLPHATNLDEVNRNFDQLSDTVTQIMRAVEKHAEVTNQNITRLAEETHTSLVKVGSDMKSILSSQTMALTIFVVVIGLGLMIGKGIWDALMGILSM